MSTPTVTEMTKAQTDAMLAEVTEKSVKSGMSREDAALFAAAKVRAHKADIRRANKNDADRENPTHVFLDIVAASLVRATENLEMSDQVANYLLDIADAFTSVTSLPSTTLAGNLRTKGADINLLPRVRRNNRNGQNNGAATPTDK